MTDQRPAEYPKASDLVSHLLDDVRTIFGTMSNDDLKWLKDKFHTTVRRHRHDQERFGKKWKRSRERLKAGASRVVT